MAARFASSSAILRSALAAHAGLSATSLLYSAFGHSNLPAASAETSSSSQSQCHERQQQQDMTSICAALPWLDQLHNLVAGVYAGALCQHDMVQIGKDVTYENPIASYAGLREVEKGFRGRLFLHPQNDVKTLLECIHVEASEDSISGGGGEDQHTQHHEHHLIGIPSSIQSSSPPKVEVTYRLSQQYGSFFSVHSLLVVTVQVRRGCTQKKVRKITPNKVAVPLATSGFTPRAASSVAVAATAHSGLASVALAKAASKFVAATSGRYNDDGYASQAAAPLVAEVVRIEEQWNGVQLLHFAPFHWSRRLNGFVAASAAYFFFS